MVEANFVQVFYREYTDVVAKNFKSFLDNDLYIDLIFICKNNKKIKAHQIVISYLSKFLYDILLDNQYDSTGKVVYICVPDVSPKVMQHIIQFIYTGKTTLDSNELKEFHEDMVLLGMPSCSITTLDEPSCSAIANTYNSQHILHQPTVSIPMLTLAKLNSTPYQCQTNGELNSNSNKATAEALEGSTSNALSLARPIISNVYSLSEKISPICNPKADQTTVEEKTSPICKPKTEETNVIKKPSPICEPKKEETNVVTPNILDNEESIRKLARDLFIQFQRLRRESRKSCFSSVKVKSANNSASRFLLNSTSRQTGSASSNKSRPSQSGIRGMKLRPRLPAKRINYKESKLVALS